LNDVLLNAICQNVISHNDIRHNAPWQNYTGIDIWKNNISQDDISLIAIWPNNIDQKSQNPKTKSSFPALDESFQVRQQDGKRRPWNVMLYLFLSCQPTAAFLLSLLSADD
jgi:hypothetical protein